MKIKRLGRLILPLSISVLTMLPTSCAGKTTVPSLDEGGFITRELSVNRDGLSLYGITYIPANIQGKVPTVIMSHGFGGTYTSNVADAEFLTKAGIASYIFDFSGGSINSKSDGSTLEMSVMTESADLNAVIDFVKRLDFVDTDNLFLMGKSQGGCVSALIAAQRADDIKGLILIYPAFVIPDDARRRFASVDEIPEQTSLMGLPLGKIYYMDVFNLDVYEAIQGYTKDVLIIHGDRDTLVPLNASERAVQVYKSAKLIVLEGAGHGFNGKDDARALDEMLKFIERHRSINK